MCFCTISFTYTDSSSGDEAYEKVMSVITHKRCMNCHPQGDHPFQGEDSHKHYFGVQRGPENHGVAGLKCSTCHSHENNLTSGVPGAPHWDLAPKSMGWVGLEKHEIASKILNRETNGGKSLDEIVHHLTQDSLVLWAWNPGININGKEREKPPLSLEEFRKAVHDWADAGAPIPKK